MTVVDAKSSVSCPPESASEASGVRLSSRPDRYVVEVARVVPDATALDFHAEFCSDDREDCVERVADLRRRHGDAIAIVVIDRANGQVG